MPRDRSWQRCGIAQAGRRRGTGRSSRRGRAPDRMKRLRSPSRPTPSRTCGLGRAIRCRIRTGRRIRNKLARRRWELPRGFRGCTPTIRGCTPTRCVNPCRKCPPNRPGGPEADTSNFGDKRSLLYLFPRPTGRQALCSRIGPKVAITKPPHQTSSSGKQVQLVCLAASVKSLLIAGLFSARPALIDIALAPSLGGQSDPWAKRNVFF